MSNRRRIRPTITERFQRLVDAHPHRLTLSRGSSYWLRSQWGQLPMARLLGSVGTCSHLTSTAGDGTYFLCHPGEIVCVDCAEVVAARLTPEEDATCDRCGHVCAGVDAGDPINPILLSPSDLTEMLAPLIGPGRTVLGLGLCK